MRARLQLILVLACLAPAALAETPQRIVTLGTAITETAYALEQGHRLVGVDSTSLYPAAARALPDVGYLRTLAAEGILSLQPDLVIASHEAGPPQVLAQLRSAGVRTETLVTGPGLEHALAAMERVGELLGEPEAGRELARRNRQQLAELARRHGSGVHEPRVLFVLGGQGAQPLIGGRDTKAATMIELAGGENVATNFSGYRPGSAEALLGMAPEVIVAVGHGVDAGDGLDRLLQESALALTPAGREGRVVIMSSDLLLGMGPRLGQAAIALAAGIRGEADN